MKDATDLLLNTGVGMGLILRDDQEAVTGLLRLANVRCMVVNILQHIAEVRWQFLYNQNGLYRDPPMDVITYAGGTITYAAGDQSFPPGKQFSFGMDFVDVALDHAADGQSLTLEFYGMPGADAEFRVQLWKLMDAGEGMRPRRVPGQTTVSEVLARADADGHLVYTIPAIDTTVYNRLGLIITRVDPRENSDPIGAYTIVLHTDAAGG